MLNNRRMKNFSNWINSKPKWTSPLIAYIYTCTSPLPQDILMVTLGLAKVKFLGIFIAVLLGNATFITLIYFLSTQTYINIPFL